MSENKPHKKSELKKGSPSKDIIIVIFTILGVIGLFCAIFISAFDNHSTIQFWLMFVACFSYVIIGTRKTYLTINNYKYLFSILVFIICLIIMIIGLEYWIYIKSISINIPFVNNIYTNIYNFLISKFDISIPHWIFFIFPILTFFVIIYFRIITIFIKEKILYNLIPFISFISKHTGEKLDEYCENIDQGKYHNVSYFMNIEKLKKCIMSSIFMMSIYFIIPIIGFLFIIIDDNFILYIFLILFSIIISISVAIAPFKLHTYCPTSPTEKDLNAQKNIFMIFYLFATLLFLIGIIGLIKV